MIGRHHLAVMVILFSATAATTLHAQFHPIGTLPGKPGKAAFRLKVDIDSVAGDGYQPIRLTFSARGRSFQRDHRVAVAIAPRNQFITTLDMSYDMSLLLPQGAQAETRTIYVPYYYPWDNLIVTIYEDGRRIDTGKGVFTVSDLRTRDAEQTTTVGIITPHDAAQQNQPWQKCPDVRTLVTVLGDGPITENADVKRLSHKDATELIQEVQPAWVQFRPIEEQALHGSWIGYSQLDIILVDATVLKRIEDSQPEKIPAITEWIASGGNLWVYGASEITSTFLSECDCQPTPKTKFVAAKRIPKMLDLFEKNDTSELTYENYQGVQKQSQHYGSRQLKDKMSTRKEVFEKLSKVKHPFADAIAPASIASGVATTRYGLGTVTLIENQDPFPGSFQFWHSVAHLHEDGQIKWLERNGVKPTQGNQNYWAWLIGSVGKPPVKSFILLNTLFVIVIGPIAYLFFRRRERLYLLFFFAPTFALLVTASLFGYAVLADGTTTRLRTRQVTWLDAKHNVSTTRSRQTYYAVLGSGAGLDFDNDVAVFPLLHSAAIRQYRYHQGNQPPAALISSTPKTQNLSGSFLPARNQVQYVTLHPDSLSGHLSFEMKSDPPAVTNQLEVEVKRMIVCDQNGKYWSSPKIPVGTTIQLSPANLASVSEIIDDRVVPNPTDVPMLSANRYSTTLNQTGLLENRLSQWPNRFPPGHFVAVADLIDDELGVSDGTVIDSVHVIMGVLP